MDIVLVVIAVSCLGLGWLIAFFAMKAKYAPLSETVKKQDSDMQTLRDILSSKEEEQSRATTERQQLLADKSAADKELELVKLQVVEKSEVISKCEQENEELHGQLSRLQADNQGVQKEIQILREQLQEKQAQERKNEQERADLSSRLEKQKEQTAMVQSQRDTAQKEVDLLKEQMLQNEKERAKALSQQMELAKEQLQNATQEILKQREETLSKTNVEQIGNVVTPLKEQLEAMQKQVNESIKTTTDNKASLERAIEDLIKQTKMIGDDANNLAKALKNESKTQGNWGEMLLDKLLESSGLVKGIHYDIQVTLRDAMGKAVTHDETGKRLIPDVVIHYPDGKDCVVDSKVSLSDYIDYLEATDETEKERALSRHLVSVRKHVKELCGKDYSSYIKPPRTAMAYTIMFIPNESAMQLALQNDTTLWREAFDKGVCIASEQNLLIILRMIQMAWIQVQQAQNQQEVFEQARKLLDRVSDFLERFDKVGDWIGKAGDAYSKAKDKLYNGQQSVVKAAKEMERLGAKTSARKQLPEPEDWNHSEEKGTNE